MSDTAARSSGGLVQSLRSNPNSAVGSLLKRGLVGVVPPAPSMPPASPTSQTKPNKQADMVLDALEKAIQEAEKLPSPPPKEVAPEPPVTPPDLQPIAQVVPQVIDQQTDTLNPAGPVSTGMSKEAVDTTTPDQVAVDAARGVQQVEQEPTPEIPPEVESYIQRVEEHSAKVPEEIVIADGSQQASVNNQLPAKPVVILPITPELEKEGQKKSPQFSLRWLVEWSKKIMKVFSGTVIYRQEES